MVSKQADGYQASMPIELDRSTEGYSFYGMNRVNLVNVFFCTDTAFVWFDSDDLHLSILQILLNQYRPLLGLLQWLIGETV